MSEHTPLTEAGRCLTCEAWGRFHCGEHSGRPLPTLLDQERQSLCVCPRDRGVETRSHVKVCTDHWHKVERILAARTSTATADDGLLDLAQRAEAAEAALERVRALAARPIIAVHCAEDGERVQKFYADVRTAMEGATDGEG